MVGGVAFVTDTLCCASTCVISMLCSLAGGVVGECCSSSRLFWFIDLRWLRVAPEAP